MPDWQVHFTSTADQQAQGQYLLLSVAFAATESSVTASLNGNAIVWSGFNLKIADAAARSGFSGTYQWITQSAESTLEPTT